MNYQIGCMNHLANDPMPPVYELRTRNENGELVILPITDQVEEEPKKVSVPKTLLKPDYEDPEQGVFLVQRREHGQVMNQTRLEKQVQAVWSDDIAAPEPVQDETQVTPAGDLEGKPAVDASVPPEKLRASAEDSPSERTGESDADHRATAKDKSERRKSR